MQEMSETGDNAIFARDESQSRSILILFVSLSMAEFYLDTMIIISPIMYGFTQSSLGDHAGYMELTCLAFSIQRQTKQANFCTAID